MSLTRRSGSTVRSLPCLRGIGRRRIYLNAGAAASTMVYSRGGGLYVQRWKITGRRRYAPEF